MPEVAVIGAGWAGCAAAVELARKGCRVSLFEAARTPGGRARLVDLQGRQLDNGQHILLGAYQESLRMMREVGIDTDKAFLRLPLQMRYPPGSGGMDFVAPRLPAPLHMLAALLRAQGLKREDKMALARFSTTARWMDWQLHHDCSVSELLERFDQTDRLIALMWRPLCIAALNTPPERASAQIFLNVLRDSLGAHRSASDMLIPRVDLTKLFPQDAAAFVQAHGGSLHCGRAVRGIHQTDSGWRLALADIAHEPAEQVYESVIVATHPEQAKALLAGLAVTESLEAFRYEPITTCYLQYPKQTRLPSPMFALIEDPEKHEWGQFVFDRGWLDAEQSGLLAVVVSTSGNAIQAGRDALAAEIATQLARALKSPGLAQPEWTKVINEKRATYACTPGLARPDNATGVEGLILAGDYTQGDYPATLEAAVRSGIRAAELACQPAA